MVGLKWWQISNFRWKAVSKNQAFANLSRWAYHVDFVKFTVWFFEKQLEVYQHKFELSLGTNFVRPHHKTRVKNFVKIPEKWKINVISDAA